MGPPDDVIRWLTSSGWWEVRELLGRQQYKGKDSVFNTECKEKDFFHLFRRRIQFAEYKLTRLRAFYF